MKVTITEDCTQCGRCVLICPQVFRPDPLHIAASNGQVPGVFDGQVVDAARTCPVYAILLVNEKKRVFKNL